MQIFQTVNANVLAGVAWCSLTQHTTSVSCMCLNKEGLCVYNQVVMFTEHRLVFQSPLKWGTLSISDAEMYIQCNNLSEPCMDQQ